MDEKKLPYCWDGGTCKHSADLAHWNGSFYLHYFANPVSGRTGPGQPILAVYRDRMLCVRTTAV